jgi:hypothetical protein
VKRNVFIIDHPASGDTPGLSRVLGERGFDGCSRDPTDGDPH